MESLGKMKIDLEIEDDIAVVVMSGKRWVRRSFERAVGKLVLEAMLERGGQPVEPVSVTSAAVAS